MARQPAMPALAAGKLSIPALPAAARPQWRSDGGVAALFLLPSLLGLLAFLVFPLIASLALSFTNWQLLGRVHFVAWRNYVTLTTADPIFWQIVRNTLLFTVEYLVLNLVISLALAVWIGSLKWGKTIFRLVFFLPTFTPLVGVSLVWLLILTPRGIMDWSFAALGLAVPNLITSSSLALQALVIVSLWSHLGYNMLLFGAALEAVPQSYLDAAALDGASGWQRFWRIRLPLISPALFFGTVLTAITTLQTFDQVYTLTRGGPGSSTATLGYAIYSQGFVTYKMGYASATAWILFAMIMALTALQLHLQRRWVHYDV